MFVEPDSTPLPLLVSLSSGSSKPPGATTHGYDASSRTSLDGHHSRMRVSLARESALTPNRTTSPRKILWTTTLLLPISTIDKVLALARMRSGLFNSLARPSYFTYCWGVSPFPLIIPRALLFSLSLPTIQWPSLSPWHPGKSPPIRVIRSPNHKIKPHFSQGWRTSLFLLSCLLP